MTRSLRLLRFPLLTAVAASSLALGTQPALARSTPSLTHQQAKRLLIAAARHHQLNPNFVLAVAYWESGWNQGAVSRTGAIGLMQIEPYTATWAGPRYLHHRADLRNPVDNAELGAALLRDYLDRLHDPKLALAAYYQGLRAVQLHGIYRSSRGYVEGIWRLRNRFQAGNLPA